MKKILVIVSVILFTVMSLGCVENPVEKIEHVRLANIDVKEVKNDGLTSISSIKLQEMNGEYKVYIKFRFSDNVISKMMNDMFDYKIIIKPSSNIIIKNFTVKGFAVVDTDDFEHVGSNKDENYYTKITLKPVINSDDYSHTVTLVIKPKINKDIKGTINLIKITTETPVNNGEFIIQADVS